jgi:metallo-beta-lactamase family protein
MAPRNKLYLTLYGAVGSVTGANFMLESSTRKILVDCGLFQGCKFCEDKNREPFPYDPASINALLVTHAHIDHIGRIPKLVRDGFRGIIYSTPATKEIAAIMLEDSLGVLTKEARRHKKEVFYNETDVSRSLSLWRGIEGTDATELGEGLSFVLRDAGHILGSSIIEVSYNTKKVVFTGDLGNTPAPLMKDTDYVTDANYMVIESVYGDRNHETPRDRRNRLEDLIEETVKRGGALLIPAFSLERTQVLLHAINELVENGRIPEVPVFLDSPLAIKVTGIYKRHAEQFNKTVQREIEGGDDIFNFPRLNFTLTTEESKAIANVPNPKIIIAGSGMSNGGRIIHHEKRHLPDSKSTLLLIGYQAAGSMGRQIQDGAKEVEILGDTIPVRARVETIRGFSAHKDSEGLLDFVAHAEDTLEKVFVTMGEPKSSLFLAQRIRDYLGVNAIFPEAGKRYELDMTQEH